MSINKLEEKIKIFQIPLTDKENKFLLMKEQNFSEGSAMNTFGEDFNDDGKKLVTNHNYKI